MPHNGAGSFVSLESCGSVHLGIQAMSCLQSLSQNLHHPLNKKNFYSSFVSSFATKIKMNVGEGKRNYQTSGMFLLPVWVVDATPFASVFFITLSHKSLKLL